MNTSDVLEIVKCAKEIFCNGIYVPSRMHPCGWDFISFENVELEDILTDYKFENSDICDGVYFESSFEGLTLQQILEKTNGKYAFERSTITWY